MRICNFPGSRRIGKPRDWEEPLDGDCHDIYVCDAIDTLSGLTVQYTLFELSNDEIEALKNGGVLRLGIVGMTAHPVFNLGVLGPIATKTINIEPCGDLGGLLAE